MARTTSFACAIAGSVVGLGLIVGVVWTLCSASSPVEDVAALRHLIDVDRSDAWVAVDGEAAESPVASMHAASPERASMHASVVDNVRDVAGFDGVGASATVPQTRAPDQDGSALHETVATVEPSEATSLTASTRVATVTYAGPGDRPRVALTFDDGPSGGNTSRILQELARLDVRATFFVEGRRVERYPELARRIVAGGHQIASHAYSHTSFRSLFPSQISDELLRTQAAIEDATGKVPRAMRPPFGRYPDSALPVIAEQGLDVVLWDVDSGDWHHEPFAIMQTVLRSVEPGSIVLLHDRKPNTAAALRDVVKGLRKRGFELVTVAELLGTSAYQAGPFVDDPVSPHLAAVVGDDAASTRAVAVAAGIWADETDR